MPRPPTDEIAVMEAVYDLTSSADQWIRAVCQAVEGNLRADLGGFALLVWGADGVSRGFQVRPLFANVPRELWIPAGLSAYTGTDPTLRKNAWSHPLSGFRETVDESDPYWRTCGPTMARAGARDCTAFVTFVGREQGLSIVTFHSQLWLGSAALKTRYQKLAKHLAVAARLRGCWDSENAVAVGADAMMDAVWGSDGRCYQAFGAARERALLEELRIAVRSRERARGSLRRRDPDQALGLWNGLVCGRWSLVDRLESDGRRFVLAIRNAPGVQDPRALTPREAEVVWRAGRGATNKEIAFELCLSEGCVSAHLHAACRKLRCSTRSDLIRTIGGSQDAVVLEQDGVTFGFIPEPACADDVEHVQAVAALSPAEQVVLKGVRGGLSNAEIARDRGTSVRTVANQVASILRKTSRNSRFELVLDSVSSPIAAERPQVPGSGTNRLLR